MEHNHISLTCPACQAAMQEIKRLREEAAEIRALVLALYTETTGPAVDRARL